MNLLKSKEILISLIDLSNREVQLLLSTIIIIIERRNQIHLTELEPYLTMIQLHQDLNMEKISNLIVIPNLINKIGEIIRVMLIISRILSTISSTIILTCVNFN